MINETNLQDVLEEYAIKAGSENDPQILRRMIAKYPQYSAELKDFAAARAVLRFAPEEELSTEEEARFAKIGLQNLRAVLSKKEISTDVLQSLTDAAKEKGLNKKSFAAALGLSVSLVQYLEKRRLDFASIPKNLIAKVAQTLETGEEIVSAYLNQPPDFATQASFKTTTRAEEMPPKNFAEAVREDQTLSAEEKLKLLKL
jgi:transcriptional regulator with XRE-family HTH domain